MKIKRIGLVYASALLIICLVTIGILFIFLNIRRNYYDFDAIIPDSKTMNVMTNVPFDDVATRSLVIFTACIANNGRVGKEPYVDGRLVSIHIISSTLVFDGRGREKPVLASIDILRPGQEIKVRTAELPTFTGNPVAKEIIVYLDGDPEPCMINGLK
jgi:hypothetical protein